MTHIYKYKQNSVARAALRATTTTKLGEASPNCKFWGTGFSLQHKNKASVQKWGQNQMGEILMKIRSELPEEEEETAEKMEAEEQK